MCHASRFKDADVESATVCGGSEVRRVRTI